MDPLLYNTAMHKKVIGQSHNNIATLRNDPDYSWLLLPIILLITIFYFWGISIIPFHPDESTQIYMSKDFSRLVTNPSSMIYIPGDPLSTEGRYRAIDAPLPRYIIGFGRSLFNEPDLLSDWDWEKDWSDNQHAGSLPTKNQLLISRVAVTIFIPLSLGLFFLSIRKVLSTPLAFLSVCYLGLHPLILLHNRRAMAESLLVFGVTLFLWAITREKIHPWLVGLVMALAVCAKQSAVALIPVGIIAVCLVADEDRHLRKVLTRLIVCLGVFSIIWYLLNPFFWRYPLAALQTSFDIRQSLLVQQIDTHLVGKGTNLLERLYFVVFNDFILPPSPYEVTSYLHETKAGILKYNSYLPHTWGRGIVPGSILFALSFGGFFMAIKSLSSFAKHKRISTILLALTFLSIILFDLFAIPIPWQRYTISLIPFFVLWTGFGMAPFFDLLSKCVPETTC